MSPTQGLLILVLATLLTSLGQVCFKKVAVSEARFIRKLLHPLFLLGMALFVCCPVLSSLAARVVDFSVLYAMTSLSFVFVLVLSRCLLNEGVDRPKVAGVVLIVIGLCVMVV